MEQYKRPPKTYVPTQRSYSYVPARLRDENDGPCRSYLQYGKQILWDHEPLAFLSVTFFSNHVNITSHGIFVRYMQRQTVALHLWFSPILHPFLEEKREWVALKMEFERYCGLSFNCNNNWVRPPHSSHSSPPTKQKRDRKNKLAKNTKTINVCGPNRPGRN